MDRGAWQATCHGIAELDMTERLSTAQHITILYVFTAHVYTMYLLTERQQQQWKHTLPEDPGLAH